MAPAGGRQSEPVYLDDHDESEEDDTAEALNRANKLMANAKKRKEAKRKAIHDEHLKRAEDLRSKMSTLFETRNSRVTKLQRAQWQRLQDLNKRRQALEARILKSMAFIEVQTSNMAKELNAMLMGRLEDLENAQTALQ